jgi:hypothetical protein
MILLQLALAFGGGPEPTMSVGPMTLADMVRYSDFVVVGRVKEDCVLPLDPEWAQGNRVRTRELHIAELEVESWVKGMPQERSLLFVNSSAWTCDITGAEIGERALYFLGIPDWGAGTESHLAGYRETYGERPLLGVLHAGRGQMEITVVEGLELCTVWIDDVLLPEGTPVLDAPGRSQFIKSVPYLLLADSVQDLAHAQRAPRIRLTALTEGTAGSSWELTVNFDRSAALMHASGTRFLRIDRSTARDLDEAVEDVLANSATIGEQPWDRAITTWAGGEELTIRVGNLTGLAEANNARAAAKIWTALRGSYDCPECLDHREADRKALERR